MVRRHENVNIAAPFGEKAGGQLLQLRPGHLQPPGPALSLGLCLGLGVGAKGRLDGLHPPGQGPDGRLQPGQPVLGVSLTKGAVPLEAACGGQGRPRGLLSIACAVHQVLE